MSTHPDYDPRPTPAESPPPSRISTATTRGLLSLLVVLVVVAVMGLSLWPRYVAPATASGEDFSGRRAMVHLPIIAAQPHPAGSPDQALVRDYLLAQLSAIGLQPEIQKARGVENVVARLAGTNPSGAVVVLAHYDSVSTGPGAGDNGSGVAALLEVARALSAGPRLRNDVIILFDDNEELPEAWAGAKAFVREHPWMKDVKLAISLDTAVAGPISTNEIGPENGWLVAVLARVYTNGAWTSVSGGGNYDSLPFRTAGAQVLALEANYPFFEQHTAADVPDIVAPASVQQMGDQVLAITRELGGLDLTQPRGEDETWFFVPPLALVHYPQSWAMPLAVAGAVLMVAALAISLIRRLTTWPGLGVALVTVLAGVAISAAAVGAVWSRLPKLMNWPTQTWSEWPEVIPPNGWTFFLGSLGFVILVAAALYVVGRRWTGRAEVSLVGLLPFAGIGLALAVAEPRAAYIPAWIVIIGSTGWIAAGFAWKSRKAGSVDLATLVAVLPFLVLLFPLIPGVFMGDGTKSIAILAGVWALIVSMILTTVDNLLVRRLVKEAHS
jgi:hypothetical protein